MPVTVNIFNPNQITIQVSVNNGDQVSIPGASPAQNWQPQQPSQSPWSFSYNPGPNTFFPGSNMVAISGVGGDTRMLRLSVPQHIQISALQLYLFLGDQSFWTLLNNGRAIASGTF